MLHLLPGQTPPWPIFMSNAMAPKLAALEALVTLVAAGRHNGEFITMVKYILKRLVHAALVTKTMNSSQLNAINAGQWTSTSNKIASETTSVITDTTYMNVSRATDTLAVVCTEIKNIKFFKRRT